jgi:hypothetical protein
MSSSTSYRLSGIALLIGSVLSVIYYVSQAFINGNDLATITSPLSLISLVVGCIGSVLVLLGLPGMYTRQAKPAGTLGLLGFLFIWYVTLYQGILTPFTAVTSISQITAHIVPQSAAVAVWTTPPPASAPFFLVSLVGQTVGILLLAIATLRARVFPRWIAWLLITTLVLGVVSFLPFVPNFLGNLSPVLGSVAIAGVGAALFSSERQERMQPAQESVAAAASA